jgi:hypothetical protein
MQYTEVASQSEYDIRGGFYAPCLTGLCAAIESRAAARVDLLADRRGWTPSSSTPTTQPPEHASRPASFVRYHSLG